jgi:hypothetical protein
LLWSAAFVFLVSFHIGVSGVGGREDKGKGEAAPAFDKLRRGMTPEQVREIVGAPKRLSRQILYHRYLEQWIYDTPVPVHLTFDCPRGRKPQLLSLHGLPVEKGEEKGR